MVQGRDFPSTDHWSTLTPQFSFSQGQRLGVRASRAWSQTLPHCFLGFPPGVLLGFICSVAADVATERARHCNLDAGGKAAIQGSRENFAAVLVSIRNHGLLSSML